MLGLVGCGDGLDALALLLAVVSPLQPLAEFLGAVTFQRQRTSDRNDGARGAFVWVILGLSIGVSAA